jgi:hypothetical protein
MNVDELDATILSHARERWPKAPMVAARTMQERGLGLSDEHFDIVVARGRLVDQGNLSRPRFSEVRLPGDEGIVRAAGRDLRR